ncbi:MAG: hypothetical protein KAS48_08360 [Gammaproteobacteria bacterium]|nr:hypothetical protein [Gammaproteobacteria bacterium]
MLLVVITLQRYFRLINLDQIILVRVFSGISVNFTDMVAITGMLILLFRSRDLVISPQLRNLLFLVLISTFITAIFSFIVLDASLGLVGNRFRSYAIYFLIPAMIIMLNKEKRLQLFVGGLMVITAVLMLVQAVEYVNGQPFVFSGWGVESKHYVRGGVFEGVQRVFFRAPPTLLLITAVSVMYTLLDKKRRWLWAVMTTVCGIAIALSLTRTFYLYAISVVLIASLLVFTKQTASVIRGLALVGLLVFVAVIVAPNIGGEGITGAVGDRFTSIFPALFDEDTHSTMDDRRNQFESIMNYIAESNVPPIFGVGVTDNSVLYFTSDLGYINIILNMGILGLAIIVGWMIYLIRMSVVVWKTSSDINYRALSGGILASMPGILLTGINIDYFTGHYFFWLLSVTVILEVLRHGMNEQRKPIGSPPILDEQKNTRLLRVRKQGSILSAP